MRFFGLITAVLTATAAAAGPERTGVVHDPELTEISGIAASRREENLFWVHNDSHNPALLFAINAEGRVLARVQVQGAQNLDWEDLAAFEEGGQSYLAIGDIGNNLLFNGALNIYVLREPALGATEAPVERHYRFQFADGPRDAEGLAVDLSARRFVIADKQPGRTRLYGLPMDGEAGVAQFIAEVDTLGPESLAPAEKLYPVRSAVSALDLSADGRSLLIGTYRHLFAFRAGPGEAWTAALARPPAWTKLPRLGGFEAACWSADGASAYAINEGEWAHLHRWLP